MDIYIVINDYINKIYIIKRMKGLKFNIFTLKIA